MKTNLGFKLQSQTWTVADVQNTSDTRNNTHQFLSDSHFEDCIECQVAQTSDEMCLLIQTYLNRDCVPNLREELLNTPAGLEILLEKYRKHLEASCTDKFRNTSIDFELKSLSDRERICIQLYVFDRKTLQEIAPIMKVHYSTVQRSIQSGLGKLRVLYGPLMQKISY